MEKDDELNNLMANLKETQNQMSVKYTSTYNEYNKNKNYDQDVDNWGNENNRERSREKNEKNNDNEDVDNW